jgi:hypothetical protein
LTLDKMGSILMKKRKLDPKNHLKDLNFKEYGKLRN